MNCLESSERPVELHSGYCDHCQSFTAGLASPNSRPLPCQLDYKNPPTDCSSRFFSTLLQTTRFLSLYPLLSSKLPWLASTSRRLQLHNEELLHDRWPSGLISLCTHAVEQATSHSQPLEQGFQGQEGLLVHQPAVDQW